LAVAPDGAARSVIAGSTRPGSIAQQPLWRRAAVALTVAAVLIPYTAWVALSLRQDAGAEGFIHLGRVMVARSHASSAISSGASSYHYGGTYGFDGQFSYFIAVDPVNARYYLDTPAYRYTRILYPMLAGILGLQKPDLVPYTLVLVNLLMIGVGTLAVAAWLKRQGASPYLGAVLGFYPGVYIALQNDTTEITAYSLIAAGIYFFDFGGRRRLWLSGVSFALALLSRETTALFAVVYAFGLLLAGEGPAILRAAQNWQGTVAWSAIVVGPFLAWKGFLFWWLGSLGLDSRLILPIPFGGLAAWWPWVSGQVEELRTIAVPGTICAVAAAWALARGVRSLPVWALLVNSLILTIFLGQLPYQDISSSGRITIGVALAAVLSTPYLLPLARVWFASSAALWLTPMLNWLALPLGHDYLSLIVRWLRVALR
jgi:hypothetical protein